MRRIFTVLVLAALGALVSAAPAGAAFGIHDFDVTFTDDQGATQSLAGTHPYEMNITFKANLKTVGPKELPEESIKDIEIFQVPGFIGDQTAVPKCPTLDFLTVVISNATACANSTAVGIIDTEASEGEGVGGLTSPLYNLEPTPGSVARLGFFVASVPVTITITTSKDPPYNLLASTRNISQVLEFFGTEVTLWGVPADPRHDKERGICYEGKSSCPPGVPPRPFLTLPRSCEGPLRTNYELDSWQNPGIWVKGFAETHDDGVPPNPKGMLGCGELAFGLTTQGTPSATSAESSSGLDFEVNVPDEGLKDPDGRAKADIRKIVTTFPAGITANPSAAEGLGVCTIAQYEAASLEDPGCPGASKLGTVEAETPLLQEHPLLGSLYLAEPRKNPFGSLLALYMIFRDPELGISIKQAGEVESDHVTGQIVTTFDDIPPFPLSHVKVHLRPGPRAPFITPPTCGTYATKTLLTPSSGAAPLESTSTFEITSGPGGSPCPAAGLPFHPGFEAGSVNNAAGRYSPFQMRLTRQDGDQDLTRFSAILPRGVTGKIAGIAKCSDAGIEAAKSRSGRAELAAPSCPASSQVGRLLGGAGVGTALTYVPGFLYLAGPYNGAPLSVAAIVPAVAGPFDIGTVVTRVALSLNQSTGEVEVDGAASDPIPHILEGLPLKVRDIRVYTDRPEFTLNPTSCAVKQARAQIFGGGNDPFSPADDLPFAANVRFQAASCASLNFKPKLALTLKGGTKRNDHPALQAVLTYPKGSGYANTRDVITTLPPTMFIDNAHIQSPCTRVKFNADECPPGSVLGTAKVVTPLLDEPLEGKVYFRSNGGERLLPDVVIDLRGQFHIVLVGFVDAKKARIRTRFLNVPDAPVSRVELKLFGGKKGLLVNSANLCRQKQRAKLSLIAQNGRRQDSNPVVGTGCEGKKKK